MNDEMKISLVVAMTMLTSISMGACYGMVNLFIEAEAVVSPHWIFYPAGIGTFALGLVLGTIGGRS